MSIWLTNVKPCAQAWANFWHRHFLSREGYTPTSADTARASLTWHGRFKDILKKGHLE